jgi:hypothetical protein
MHLGNLQQVLHWSWLVQKILIKASEKALRKRAINVEAGHVYRGCKTVFYGFP